MFDILENDEGIGLELVFEFDDEKQDEMADDIFDQTQDIGYDSHNSIMNLKTVAVIYLFYLLKLPLIVVVKLFSLLLGGRYYTKEIYNFLYDALFFKEILTILLEGYIEFLIAAYFNLINNEALDTTNGEIQAKYFIMSILPLALIVLPLIQIWFIF